MPGTKAHNFLKLVSACSPAKRWARQLPLPGAGVLELVDAWNKCEEPFWLIWALYWANKQDARIPVLNKGNQIRALFEGPLKNLANAGTAFNKQSAAAYATYLKYPGDQTVMDNALTQANQGAILAACGTMPGQGKVSQQARAALALLHAIISKHPRNDYNLGAIIESADRAHAFAIDALNTDATGKRDRNACKAARAVQAQSMRVDTNWLDLTKADVMAALTNLDANSANAPPWAPETEPDTKPAGISSPTASPWYASIKGGTVWYVFGTDGQDTVVSRTATVQDNVTSATTAGSPIAPSAQNDWGFSFPNLTSGDSVSLNVTITYPNPTAPDVLLRTYTIG
jgi:hypothetical protein